MTTRPATSKLSAGQLAMVLFYTPATAVEHLAHAWAALDSGDVAYAANRLACAKSEAVQQGVGPRSRKSVAAEIASLEAVLGGAS